MRLSRILPQLLALGAGVLVVTLPEGPASAREYNTRPFLPPEHQVKIQKVIARGRQMQAGGGKAVGITIKPGEDVVNQSCGSLRVGNVDTGNGRPGQRAPRENIVVARDIINTGFGCGR